MRYWDSSAVVPLLVGEPTSRVVTEEAIRDRELVVWWATSIECVSAIARQERDGRLDRPGASAAIERLRELREAWSEVQPVDRVREVAVRLLRTHDLRAADAMQLSAAIAASEDRPASLGFVTLDDRLARAAEREGFKVVMPAA